MAERLFESLGSSPDRTEGVRCGSADATGVSLERVVAAAFKERGETPLSEQEIVVALSLRRDWVSPAQAERLIERAQDADLLVETADGFCPALDPAEVEIPSTFVPDESLFTKRSVFEEILDRLVESGQDKQATVGAINELQGELGLTIEAAAAIYASKRGIDVGPELRRAKRELLEAG